MIGRIYFIGYVFSFILFFFTFYNIELIKTKDIKDVIAVGLVTLFWPITLIFFLLKLRKILKNKNNMQQ